ncbi:MAG: toxin [Bacteroidetes bacterium]|nr:toxin [Bacteroidota bacterium]
MPSSPRTESGRKPSIDESFFATAPSITLPKGGGALKGIGEKFAANPVNGTGSMSIPIDVSHSRSDLQPALTLSYDSGSGNEPFGLGWHLTLPNITRKTDKGLPQYQDARESDVFILAGAEDLVPVLDAGGAREVLPPRTVDGVTYNVSRYRPRIESLFSRIELWTDVSSGATHWRTITRDNVTTLYGRDNNARIFDPLHPTHVFTWLICESYDDKGNTILYEYREENSDNVDTQGAHESNRTNAGRSANRYPKRIRYGNRTSRMIDPDPAHADWMFDVVFDYGEHDPDNPTPDDTGMWLCRRDPFSMHRAGFDVRTYRLCRRVLIFHHFPELAIDPYLVRSISFTYQEATDVSFMTQAVQSGHVWDANAGAYITRSLPPLEFTYSQAVIDSTVRDVDVKDRENLPRGLDGSVFQWVDLDGEGVSGLLTEQGRGWFYKPNLSPINPVVYNGQDRLAPSFGASRPVMRQPNAMLGEGGQMLDLAGDGTIDFVQFDGTAPGFYERTQGSAWGAPDDGWDAYVPFTSRPNVMWNDPNLKFMDLTGDGHADLLITENEVFTWYPSLAEAGFGAAQRVQKAMDEEKGPQLVFADLFQSIFIADMSGDGLADLVRVRNGEICYWPNLGYGRFGAKVAMDASPHFDLPERFDQRRIRIADIDGTGPADIIYLGADGIDLYFNQSGNSWSVRTRLGTFPRIDDLASVMTVDLLGNGTACLVWSSALGGDAERPMRYIDLMSGNKPHLLVKSVNNLGAETSVQYAPSTKFYLADRYAGRPWITRIPFPVHVVERVETRDRISGNLFVTRYAYHHGHFDGVEREFRGFGMVERWDTEEFASLNANQGIPSGTNIDASSHIPPVLTRTWYHTGVFVDRNHVSDYFAGMLNGSDVGEYYREPGTGDADARDLMPADTRLPDGLTAEEQRQACRALKGQMLRQEVFATDGTAAASHPYTVTHRNYTIRCVQPMAGNRYGAFYTHEFEALSYHYERNPADPRIGHALTLETDAFGNVLKSAVVGYGRRTQIRVPDGMGGYVLAANAALGALDSDDQARQTTTLVTYTENVFTNAIAADDDYRLPQRCQSLTYQLTGYTPSGPAGRFLMSDFVTPNGGGYLHVYDSEIPYEAAPGTGRQRRPVECERTYYRPDDLGTSQNDMLALLQFGELQPRAMPGESYKLAFTSGLLTDVYQRPRGGGWPENLLPIPDDVLAADITGGMIADRGGYVDLDGDGNWWVPSGRRFYSIDPADTAALELDNAEHHFFLAGRYRDPFGSVATVAYDAHDLLILQICDAVGNYTTVGERDPDPSKPLVQQGYDYRVLQPALVMNPNRNRSAAAFDALGHVAGTALMGKPEDSPALGDLIDASFNADPDQTDIDAFIADPTGAIASTLLANATTRMVYDLGAYLREPDPLKKPPVFAAVLARETHVSDPVPPGGVRIQVSIVYSDGFGREIQKKMQAEPGPVPTRDVNGRIIVGTDGLPVMTGYDVGPRWVGSGWKVFNNKGKEVRTYEPFFTDLHVFEFEARIGMSPVLFYDPVERVVAKLRPDHTWEKTVFDAWRQDTWDANDTVLAADPSGDPDAGDFFGRLETAAYLPTWYAQRSGGGLGAQEQDAAAKAAVHAATPTVAHLDGLGRTFLTIVHNAFKYGNALPTDPATVEFHPSRSILDIEGYVLEARDAIVQNGDAQGRIVMQYTYDMLGHRIYQFGMDGGERWMLHDVVDKAIRSWDSRAHAFRTEYDPMRRAVRAFAVGADPSNPARELMVERMVYGEQHPNREAMNLSGTIYLHCDQAGAMSSESYDFKGNVLVTLHRPALDYRNAADWSSVDGVIPAPPSTFNTVTLEGQLAPVLEATSYQATVQYDALNRPVSTLTPDNSTVRMTYNEGSLLETVDANLRGALSGGFPVWTAFITDIDYDARGKRTAVAYGNGVTSEYTYSPLVYRLARLVSTRDASYPANQQLVQDLSYTYDPVGNVTHIHDDADIQNVVYFNNRRVDPSADYIYDAAYRLIEASGREHLGLTGGGLAGAAQPGDSDAPRTNIAHPGDGNAVGTYIERYEYDGVGNILSMNHLVMSGGWRRYYAYTEPSLIEPSKTSNRINSTSLPGDNPAGPYSAGYTHDEHGNILTMPHLPVMQWDYHDQLHATSRQVVMSGTPETTYFAYGADGERVRKATEWQAGPGQTPARKADRIYVGGFEIYREYDATGSVVQLERETLHIMDGRQRVAMVETKTVDVSVPPMTLPETLTRYQYGNHLDSATLELDDTGDVISYEEYFPFGSTAYQAVRSQTQAAKRYRHTGRERDEETGLQYHTTRYYAPWLGRWSAADPAGMVDGDNLYRYARCNPIRFNDPNGMAPPGGPGPSLNFGIRFTGSFSNLTDLGGYRASTFFTLPGRYVSAEGGVNVSLQKFSKIFNNTTGGGTFFNIEAFAMVGHGDNSNLLGSNSTGKGIPFFNPKGGSGFVGIGYSYNLNRFTGGMSELSNRTGGLLIRGSFGSNNIGFSMFNDFAKAPHWGGGTDQGLTGTGDLMFTHGLRQNESFSTGLFFRDITGIPDRREGMQDCENSPRFNPKNPLGVYRTIGLNKDLNFGIFGLKTSYSNETTGGALSIYRYGGAQGALFQDPIHNGLPIFGKRLLGYTSLFPYDMHNSKTGVELEIK